MNTRLVFTTSTEIVRVPSDTVVYVTAAGNYSTITMADGGNFVLTMQLGQIERRVAELLESNDNRFIRIGKSLIVNRDYIAFINPPRQKMVLSGRIVKKLCLSIEIAESEDEEFFVSDSM